MNTQNIEQMTPEQRDALLDQLDMHLIHLTHKAELLLEQVERMITDSEQRTAKTKEQTAELKRKLGK